MKTYYKYKLLTHHFIDHDDSLMPELEIFNNLSQEIFDEASFDEENKSGAHALQGFVTPSSTKVNASGEEQVEDISLNTLRGRPISLSKVASLAKEVSTASLNLVTGSEQGVLVGDKKSSSSPDKGPEQEQAHYDH
ncbi:hypothetical protein Tco_0489615 [Tanacetum coccineum]